MVRAISSRGPGACQAGARAWSQSRDHNAADREVSATTLLKASSMALQGWQHRACFATGGGGGFGRSARRSAETEREGSPKWFRYGRTGVSSRGVELIVTSYRSCEDLHLNLGLGTEY